jgi:hypothetical protein
MVDYTMKLLLTKTGLNILYGKCELFKRMIQEKSPGRLDLIESFEYSKNECTEAMIFLEDMDREYRVLRQRNLDLETICLKLSSENKQLKNTNDNLISKLDL